MKKRNILFLILIFIFSMFIHGEKVVVKVDNKTYYTAASEAGFESEALYQCILGHLGDLQPTDENLAQITEVICRSSHIQSTKGIEKLTALRYLNLYDNDVSSIDLSHNTNLVMLNMTFNDLTSIDLSHNTNLQQLYLNGNKISSIDLSHNTGLIDLNVYNNKLTSIDVSMLPNLKFILLSLNKLTSIDLSNNSQLEHVYLSGNQLTNVKMPTNGADNFTRLDLNANKLESIDVSDLPNLNYLIVSANKLSSLDVSNNTELEYLYASSNQLSSIDLTQQIDLRYLNLSLNNLSSIDLSHNINLEKLYISSNKLNKLSLNNLNNLREVNAVFNNFEGYDIPNKENITYLVVDYSWANDLKLYEYTNLEKLDIDYYYKLFVSEDSIPVSKVLEYIPEGIALNRSSVYKGFGNVSNKSISMCEYSVADQVSGVNEATDVSVCTDDTITSNTLTSSDKKIQVFSTDLSVRGLNTNAEVQFDGYYEIVYNWDQTVIVPNTSAFTSMIGVILSIIVLGVGLFILSYKLSANKQ